MNTREMKIKSYENFIKDGAYLLLRIRSAHLEILGFPMGGGN